MKRSIMPVLVIFAVLSAAPAPAFSSEGSWVIGRVTGIRRELPGYFQNNVRLMVRGKGGVEIPGFRLLRKVDSRAFLIRPNREGFFFQELPGGTYTLSRKRNDRPDYRMSRTFDIMEFEVKAGTIVNLGTIDIVLEGKPEEHLKLYQKGAKGTYIYIYRYERISGERAYSRPWNWFQGRKRDIASRFGERVMKDGNIPTGETDSSRVKLRDFTRFEDD